MANFSKKIVSTVSATAIVATAMGTSFVSAASEFLPYAEALVAKEVIGAQSTEAGFRLNDQITRAELAKVAANLAKYQKVSCTGKVYSDVTTSLGDLCEAIETLASAGVINTSATNFRPNDNVTRAEMTKMLLGALSIAPSATSAGYADVTANLGDLVGYINRANELKCAQTATYFRPAANSSRGEAFKIASCAAKLEVSTTKPMDTTKPVVTNGTVTVAAVGNATAQYVPANASSVNVGTFKVTATGGDVVLNSITIGRSGLGNSSTITIAVADKNGRISESRSVNSSTQEAVIRLNNPITLKAGESIDLSALATVNTDVNAQHQFALKAVNGQAVTPVTLGLINTTSYTTSTVTVDTLTINNVTSGRNDQVLGRVTLRAGSQDATIHGFTLTKESGVDLTRAFANVNVYRNGTKVGKAMVTSDKIVVTELATDLVRNNSATYELRADVVYVGSQDTVKLALSESEDVSATEKSTGYATQVAGAPKSGTATLSALDIVTTRKTTSNTTVAPGASNVLLIDGTISSEASFDITKFTVTTKDYPAGANAKQVFSSLTLNIGGNDYELMNGDSLVDNLGAANGTKTFSASGDRFRVEPGTATPVTLRGTLLNTAPAGKVQFEVTLDAAKNISNGNTVDNLGKKVTGVAYTISAPSLTIKNATVSAPTGSKIFSNAVDLEIGRFGVEAKADEVSVNRIVIENTGDIATLSDVFSNARLINVADGSTVASNPTAEGKKYTFNSVNLRVAKDATANLKLVVDTNGDLVTNNANQTFIPKVVIAAADVSTNTASNATTNDSFTVTKTYTISSNAPTVNVTPLGLNANNPVASVKVINTDDSKALTLKEVKIGIAFRSTANGTVDFPTHACLRDRGSSAKCGEAGTTASVEIVKGDDTTFDIAASTLTAKDAVSSSNGSTEFEIFFPGNTPWVAGDNVNVNVNSLKYMPEGGADLTESYVGTNGASVTVTK